MQGHLVKVIDENRYYLIDNVGAYNYIVTEFETFRSMFISIDTVERTMFDIEFNVENIRNLLNNHEAFEGFIDYQYFDTHNYIIFHNRVYYIQNWIDLFNFATKII